MEKPAENKKTDLVLEGGGVRGFGLVGAIVELAKQGYDFQRVAGTSAGAVVGSFAAAGCDSDTMIKIMRSLDYRRLRDDTLLSRFGPPGKAMSLLFQNGLYKGDYLEKWLEEQLAGCGIKTFSDLRLHGAEFEGLPENERYKLVVITADLSKGQLVYLPWDYHKYGLDPDTQSVSSAVRASMSIPFLYRPMHIGADTLVDGSVLSNFPVDTFDAPSNSQPDWPTLGIKLTSREKANLIPRRISGPLSFAGALLTTILNGHDQRHLDNPATLARTVFVDTGNTQVTNFDITSSEQEILFNNGQIAARKFLKTWDFTAFKKLFVPAPKG